MPRRYLVSTVFFLPQALKWMQWGLHLRTCCNSKLSSLQEAKQHHIAHRQTAKSYFLRIVKIAAFQEWNTATVSTVHCHNLKINATLAVSLCWHECGFERAYAVQRCPQCGIQGWLRPAGYQLCSSDLSTSGHWASLHLGPPQNRSAPQGYQHQLTVTHSRSEKKFESFYILTCIYLVFQSLSSLPLPFIGPGP